MVYYLVEIATYCAVHSVKAEKERKIQNETGEEWFDSEIYCESIFTILGEAKPIHVLQSKLTPVFHHLPCAVLVPSSCVP